MGNLSIILYITIAISLLLFLSLSPGGPHNNHKLGSGRRHGPVPHRRLKLRSRFFITTQDPHQPHQNHQHDPVAFDPEVAELERHREDKQWEQTYFNEHHPDLARQAQDMARRIQHEHQKHLDNHQENHHDNDHEHEHDPLKYKHEPEWDDFMDDEYNSDEEYLNDEDKFNVTNRLVALFPKIDVDPVDGFVSEKELTQWNLDQALKEMMYRSKREMEVHDKNHDGFVSFHEYEPPGWVKTSDNAIENNMGWWKEEHFNASDMNEDGLLNLTEYNDFLHPSDSKNPKLLQWLCNEEIRERDTDKDGKLNFDEFFHGLFDLVRNHVVEEHNSSQHSDDVGDNPAAKTLFNQLDKDSDGFLSDTELLPIINKLHPSEDYYAGQQANYIISQADNDKDGRLSLTEMIENPYVFYSSVFSENDYDYHDELR